MTIDSLEVKPCPYCGNTAPVLYHRGDGFVIHCGRWHCDSKYAFIGGSKDACIKHWNEEAERILKKYDGGEP